VSADDLSVLGDAAEWIWNLVERHFAVAAQVLEVYHGGEQLAKAGRAVFGEGGDLEKWLAETREKMIGYGYWGVCEVIAALGVEEQKAARLGVTGARYGTTSAASREGWAMHYDCGGDKSSAAVWWKVRSSSA
jgi:hypothetical protein